jgi:hypothetical protein
VSYRRAVEVQARILGVRLLGELASLRHSQPAHVPRWFYEHFRDADSENFHIESDMLRRGFTVPGQSG